MVWGWLFPGEFGLSAVGVCRVKRLGGRSLPLYQNATAIGPLPSPSLSPKLPLTQLTHLWRALSSGTCRSVQQHTSAILGLDVASERGETTSSPLRRDVPVG